MRTGAPAGVVVACDDGVGAAPRVPVGLGAGDGSSATSCAGALADSCAGALADSCAGALADSCAGALADSCADSLADVLGPDVPLPAGPGSSATADATAKGEADNPTPATTGSAATSERGGTDLGAGLPGASHGEHPPWLPTVTKDHQK
ncbi:hypothetical protein GCM10025862_30700 [Arsenicicoccus piscis]|uniref:Uncharacterized protein n=1 Tax=Arsenicicoccus piscis TaxID=673954 RepID=A0ABQ6HU51_9MICO|nr:hypothetical protein GCM10025862_30700 [Arsenicicoccus piscis]